MKITVFQSDKGDCLMLEGRSKGRVLADGGMPKTYSAHVAPVLDSLRKKKEKIDVVYVSHIDEDHISGILQMMDDEVAWRTYEYQKTGGGNKKAKTPAVRRPPAVNTVWHNAFHEQVSDNKGKIEDMLAATVAVLAGGEAEKYIRMAEFHQDVATSIRQAINLSRRLGEKQLNIRLNPEFDGKLMLLKKDANGGFPSPIKIGSMSWSVIGPTAGDLRELRKEWDEWLRNNEKALASIEDASRKTEKKIGNSLPMSINRIVGANALQAELLASNLLSQLASKTAKKVLGVRGKVTVPNLASLMFLVEEKDGNGNIKTVLMTGDGHHSDVIKGLESQGRLDNGGSLHVDVLKVQHHGSEHNLDREFCKRIIADHYVFCGNGAHENPDIDVVQAVIDSRLSPQHQGSHANVNKPFKLWFNSSSSNPETEQKNRDHMKKVEELVSKASKGNSKRLRSFFLKTSKFEIKL